MSRLLRRVPSHLQGANTKAFETAGSWTLPLSVAPDESGRCERWECAVFMTVQRREDPNEKPTNSMHWFRLSMTVVTCEP